MGTILSNIGSNIASNLKFVGVSSFQGNQKYAEPVGSWHAKVQVRGTDNAVA